MPRKARAAPGGLIYHIYNRGNGRLRIFNRPEDYDLFLTLLSLACQRASMRLLGYCLLPTHWHLVLWPRLDHDLAAFVGWLSNTHVRRWHQLHASVGGGHIYQGRYRSFPVQPDFHLATLLRYVEANPARARLVPQNAAWPWSSLAAHAPLARSPRAASLADLRTASRAPAALRTVPRVPLHPWPLPDGWLALVETPLPPADLDSLRTCLRRSRPYGDPDWTRQTAKSLNLQHTLRHPWRPARREFA